jgi:hypothetical protein
MCATFLFGPQPPLERPPDMSKALHEMTFADVVERGVELELDAVVQGMPLSKRVYAVVDLAVRWAAEQRKQNTRAE